MFRTTKTLAAALLLACGNVQAQAAHPVRPWVLGGLHVTGQTAFYLETQIIWGRSSGRFHVKDDWTHDQLGQTDELSHLFVAYTMTQEVAGEWQWAGMTPANARTVAALESALLATVVEGLDAFNPKQGFGVSDLLFGYAGIGASMWTLGHREWDIKTSVKSDPIGSQGRLFARTVAESDNSIFWATWRPALGLAGRQPFSLGLGHSTRRASDGISPVRELHLGIGTTLPDVVRLVSPRAARYIGILDYYYFNVNVTATLK